LSLLTSVRGRFETIKKNGITAIIDYAHTPDALKNVLKTINEIKSKESKLITVVGAGGNRDKSKRPVMAQIAESESNRVILTSDNPRNEDPEEILNDMSEGISNYKQVLKITNREEAIKTAIFTATSGDIVLIAGKGHETYQEINGIRHHSDDKEIAEKALNQLSN
jgi:UDP-N-acetylmuramoyl-L-alanyl-D-glutamate--2,6-diaminopimelate ligase